MKKLFLFIAWFVGFSVLADSMTPVSVTQFTGDAALSGDDEVGCYYWTYFGPDRLGSAFQERLISELVKDKHIKVLERQTLSDVYSNEFKLPNSAKEKPVESGHFQKAKYTLVGVVKSFAWCTGGEELGLNVGQIFGFGDLNVGGRKNKAEVAVEVRIIDVRTGQVIESVTGKGERTNFKVGVNGLINQSSFTSKKFKNSPIGEAIDEAIAEASQKIKTILNNRMHEGGAIQ